MFANLFGWWFQPGPEEEDKKVEAQDLRLLTQPRRDWGPTTIQEAWEQDPVRTLQQVLYIGHAQGFHDPVWMCQVLNQIYALPNGRQAYTQVLPTVAQHIDWASMMHMEGGLKVIADQLEQDKGNLEQHPAEVSAAATVCPSENKAFHRKHPDRMHALLKHLGLTADAAGFEAYRQQYLVPLRACWRQRSQQGPTIQMLEYQVVDHPEQTPDLAIVLSSSRPEMRQLAIALANRAQQEQLRGLCLLNSPLMGWCRTTRETQMAQATFAKEIPFCQIQCLLQERVKTLPRTVVVLGSGPCVNTAAVDLENGDIDWIVWDGSERSLQVVEQTERLTFVTGLSAAWRQVVVESLLTEQPLDQVSLVQTATDRLELKQ